MYWTHLELELAMVLDKKSEYLQSCYPVMFAIILKVNVSDLMASQQKGKKTDPVQIKVVD